MKLISIIFLGTSAGTPSKSRWLPSILIHDERNYILLDVGEGTQYRLLQIGLNVHKITHILITHLHGDHVFGLLGLIASMTLLNRVKDLIVIGPVGIQEMLNANIKFLGSLPFKLNVIETNPDDKVLEVYKQGDLCIKATSTKHTCNSIAFSIEWKVPIGKFKPEKAIKLKVPIKYWKLLQYGEVIKLENGRIIKPEDVIEITNRGFVRIVYTGDTAPCENIIKLARDADILIHEATFSRDENAKIIWNQGHSRTIDAAEIAKKANVKLLILTHISTRYEGLESKLLEEAKEIFPNTLIAYDLMKIRLRII